MHLGRHETILPGAMTSEYICVCVRFVCVIEFMRISALGVCKHVCVKQVYDRECMCKRERERRRDIKERTNTKTSGTIIILSLPSSSLAGIVRN